MVWQYEGRKKEKGKREKVADIADGVSRQNELPNEDGAFIL